MTNLVTYIKSNYVYASSFWCLDVVIYIKLEVVIHQWFYITDKVISIVVTVHNWLVHIKFPDHLAVVLISILYLLGCYIRQMIHFIVIMYLKCPQVIYSQFIMPNYYIIHKIPLLFIEITNHFLLNFLKK